MGRINDYCVQKGGGLRMEERFDAPYVGRCKILCPSLATPETTGTQKTTNSTSIPHHER